MRLVLPFVVALLAVPAVLGAPLLAPPDADKDPEVPTDPRAALLFAARAAGLDSERILALAAPGAASSDAATAYADLLDVLGLEPQVLPALPGSVAQALVPLLDAASDAVRLRTEALAGLDAGDHARLHALHDAYLASRLAQDRGLLATASADGGLPNSLDRERIAAAAYRLTDAGLRAAPVLAGAATDWPTVSKGAGGGLCVDDGIGVLIVCGPFDDVLTGNHILEIDLGGNDAHATNAGASGLGVLWQGSNGLPAALALDIAGDDSYGGGSQVQGTGSTTPGVLLDLGGDDSYHAGALFFTYAQGAGNLGGVGILHDAAGNDAYTTPWGRVDGDTAWDSQGFGILGGIGLLVDPVGDDAYIGGQYAQGVGDFNAVGLLVDGDGNDHYEAVKRAQGFGDGAGQGLLLDGSGNDYHLLWEDIGQGAGIGGGGLLLDVSGSDAYVAFYGRAQGWAVDGVAWKPLNDVLRELGLSAVGSGVVVDLEGDDAWAGSPGCDLCVWNQGNGVGIDTL